MTRLIKDISKKDGLKPGSVVFVGRQKVEKTRIDVIDYNETELSEYEIAPDGDFGGLKDSPNTTWINIDGLHDTALIERIGKVFELDELVLEDIVNTGQRPKLEIGEKYIFVVLKGLYTDESDEIYTEQLSVIFGEKYILSFRERTGRIFDSVKDRLKKTIPRKRFVSSDYLAYSLIDAIVDKYFISLEAVSAIVEDIEDSLINNPETSDLEAIHDLKRKLILMRKAVWPLREVIGGLERTDSELVQDFTGPYLRDLYEHAIQVIDTTETFRDMVSGLLDIYLTSVSNKMNEVMKVLTLIATIFIPLGFLAGVYGMNFDRSVSDLNMPELGFPYGYIMFWGLALIIGVGLLIFFKKKKWL